jgi:hypothetical protein
MQIREISAKSQMREFDRRAPAFICQPEEKFLLSRRLFAKAGKTHMLNRFLLTAVLVFTSAGVAQAIEGLPKRKPGLWEIQTQMRGIPARVGPVQICTDEKSDDIMRQGAEDMKPQCSVMDVKKVSDHITVNSVCKIMAITTATTTATFTGSFDSNYRADIHSAYDPPIHGKTETNMTIAAKWLGPCKEGQKAGDVVLPNMGATGGGHAPNVQDLMKMREQLKQMQKQ